MAKRKTYRKLKRRGAKRRRYSKKRGKYSRKLVRKAVSAINRQRFPPRNYLDDDHSGTIAVPDNMVKWVAFGEVGSRDVYKCILKAANTPDATLLSTEASEAALDASIKKYLITRHSRFLHLRNMSPHPMHVTWYVISSKRTGDYGYGISSFPEQVLNDLQDGWQKHLDDTADAYITYDGTNAATVDLQERPSSESGLHQTSGMQCNATAYQLQVKSKHLTPSMSSVFKSSSKIIFKKTMKVPPGADIYYNLKTGNFTWDAAVMNPVENDEGAGGTGEYFQRYRRQLKGFTRCILMKIHGAIGHGIGDATQQALIGYMGGSFAVEQVMRARVYPIQSTNQVNSMRVKVDAAPATGYEGPSEHTIIADDL